MRLETLLQAEIEEEFSKLSQMEVGTETYKTTVDGLTKLIEKVIEIDKNENDIQTKKAEEAFKKQQIEDENKDRLVKNIIAAAGIVIPVGVTIWGTLMSFKFEEEGTITTIMGRGFINKLLPRK